MLWLRPESFEMGIAPNESKTWTNQERGGLGC